VTTPFVIPILLAAGVLAAAAPGAGGGPAKLAYVVEPSTHPLDANIWVGTKPVAAQVGVTELQPAWSPDGSRLAFTSQRIGPAAAGTDIEVVNADGTGRRRLTYASASVEYTAPSWSPDGKEIAYVRSVDHNSRGIFVMKPDGSGKRALLRDRCATDPAWSPDGRQIALSYCGTIAVVNADGTGRRKVSHTPPHDSVADADFFDQTPAWSPDGKTIAFVRDESFNREGGGDDFTINVALRDGTGERQLTPGSEDRNPSWSHDGRTIAFDRYADIWSVAPTGGPLRRVMSRRNAYLSDPAWRP
jgi:TolB protein